MYHYVIRSVQTHKRYDNQRYAALKFMTIGHFSEHWISAQCPQSHIILWGSGAYQCVYFFLNFLLSGRCYCPNAKICQSSEIGCQSTEIGNPLPIYVDWQLPECILANAAKVRRLPKWGDFACQNEFQGTISPWNSNWQLPIYEDWQLEFCQSR